MENHEKNTFDSSNQNEEEEESSKGFSIRVFFQTALVTLVVILSLYLVYGVYDYYHEPQYQANEVIEELPTPSSIEETHEQGDDDLEKDQPYYENQVGYLTVDGVDVTNEPIMQHPTEDEYYLYKNEEGKYSIWGSYYVYHDWNMSSIADLDKVTVIFGHSNGNSLYRKFSVLKNFKDADFARQHQYIYMTIGEEKSRWKIFAVADYPVENNYVQVNPSDEFLEWEIEQMKSYSYNQYQVEVTPDDKILILSTCTGSNQYDTRFIVCAVYDGLC